MSGKIKIYNPITEKETIVDPYGRTAKKIYKFMIDAGSEPDTILPADITYNNGRFIKVKPVEDVSNVRRITYSKVKASGTDDTFSYFKKMMKSYQGQTIKLVKRYSTYDVEPIDFDDDDDIEDFKDYITNIQEVQESVIFEIPIVGFNSWWVKNSYFFIIDSDTEVFGDWNEIFDDQQLQAQLLILTLDKVDKEDFNQYFLDGINHCFFYPIKEWADKAKDDAKSKSAIARYNLISKKVTKYIEKYFKGLPEEDVPLVCNDLQISVEIDLPSTMLHKDIKFIEVESQKKALKKFRYVNTRLNHIELNRVNTKDNYIEEDQFMMEHLFKNFRKNDEFILWKENANGITQINTNEQIFKLKDKEDGYNQRVKEFEEEYNFSDYKIEVNQNKQLTEFLETSLNTNQSITFLPEMKDDGFEYIDRLVNYLDDDYAFQESKKNLDSADCYYEDKKNLYDWIDTVQDLNHIDIRKAYTQGHNCSAYQGYLGKITDFRRCDKIVGLGIYKIKNINFNGSVIEKMKCLHENSAYPSPELEFYRGLGITFDITMGCWGSSFDFEFGEGMEMKENGVPHYCKWYGCLMKITDKERYNFSCKDIDFAKLNSYHSNNTIRYNYDGDAGIIEYDKKYSYHSYHIASFIASYSRITLLEQLLNFNDFNQVVSVVVDGIYYRGDVEVNDLFSQKEKKSLRHSVRSNEYVIDYGVGPDLCDAEFRENNRHEIHLGAGGCGKTHNNLTDEGFVNPLFVAPSWKLARNKKEEYGVDSTTFFHTLDNDPDKWRKLNRNYNVFIFDEISMLSDEGKEKLIKRFPKHKIIFCGDVGYQLPPIEGKEFNVECGLPVFHHTTNYRCKCTKLEKRLLYLRKIIKQGIDSIGIESIVKSLRMDVISSDDIDYNVNDMILCATHDKKDKYTEKYKHLEKYSIKENTLDYSNGQIIIGPKPKKVSCELRHSYTVHACQGETATHKLFIEIDKMKSLKMIYTAMSRARTLDQIQFISWDK